MPVANEDIHEEAATDVASTRDDLPEHDHTEDNNRITVSAPELRGSQRYNMVPQNSPLSMLPLYRRVTSAEDSMATVVLVSAKTAIL